MARKFSEFRVMTRLLSRSVPTASCLPPPLSANEALQSVRVWQLS
jgi:hypothetical protein